MDCSLPGSSIHGIFQEEYWGGVPLPSPGDLPDPGVKPGSHALQADSLPLSQQGSPTTMLLLLPLLTAVMKPSLTALLP